MWPRLQAFAMRWEEEGRKLRVGKEEFLEFLRHVVDEIECTKLSEKARKMIEASLVEELSLARKQAEECTEAPWKAFWSLKAKMLEEALALLVGGRE